jgi:hypothetical protein
VTINSVTGDSRFAISPDRKHALYSNAPFCDDPYTSTVSVIDIATGRVTPLPQLAKAMGSHSGFTSIAWNADNKTQAASSSDSDGAQHLWLLDTQHDTATQLKVPTAGNVAGWTPGNGPLILTSGSGGGMGGIGQGPYTISAVTIGVGGQATETTLTSTAMTFSFLGFIHPA